MRSFDVFDTVLVRMLAEPHDVALRLGGELLAAGIITLRAEEFAQARQAAQDRAAHVAPAGEATLDEIYAELARALGWEPAAATAARDREIALEGRLVRGVPARRREIAAARSGGGSMVFLSDTQLPSLAIRGWLEREGLWMPGDRLFVSCEARASKREGSLFRVALRETGASPGAWRHVGDNPRADVTAPRELGLEAREETAGRLTRRERRLRGADRHAPAWRSAVAGVSRLVRLNAPTEEIPARILWTTAASVAAPLFFAFTAWVLEEARRRGVRRLYFVARGGQVFFRIAEQLGELGLTEIDCRYLHLSRRALAGLGEARQGRMRESLVAPGEVVQTLARIQSNLGFSESDPLPTGWTAADRHRALSLSEREQIADWYLAPERRGAVERRLDERAALAHAYLEQAGVCDGERMAFVDTGWAGSLQRALEDFFGDAGQPSAQTWFYLGLRDGAEKRVAGPALGYLNAFRPLPLEREPWLSALLELMARADHGTLRAYSPAPLFEPIAAQEVAMVRDLQSAVLTWTREYLTTTEGVLPPAAECAPVVIDGFSDFAAHPSKAEALAWGRIAHQVHPADPRAEQLSPELNAAEVALRLANPSRRPPAWWLPGQAAMGGASGALIGAWLGLRRLRPARPNVARVSRLV